MNYRKNGEAFWNRLRISPIFNNDGNLIAHFGTQNDVTDAHEQQRAYEEVERLSTLGCLSSNISHELKNIFQPILLMTEMLQDWRNMDDEMHDKCLAILEENTMIGDSIVKDVLRFSAPPKNTVEDMVDIPVIDLLDDVSRFVKNLSHGGIAIQKLYDQEDACFADQYVSFQRGKFFQVIINLISNASDAMGRSGQVTIGAEIKTLDDTLASKVKDATHRFLCLSFTDTGEGIPEENINFIFDPFFSTKSEQKGTGLGLSVSYKIIKELGGTMYASSEKDQGSTLSICLPVHKKCL